MKDWFHAILEHLYKSYPLDHSFHNINDFLQRDLNIDNVNGNSLHQLSAILFILKEKKYIEGLPQVKNQLELTRDQVIGLYVKGYETRNSLLTHDIKIRLTIDGYVYMQERELKSQEHQSIITTNNSVRGTNTKVWIIAGVAALFSILTFFKSCRQDQQSQEKLLLLQKQLHDSSEQIRETLHFDIHRLEDSIKNVSNLIDTNSLQRKH